MELSAAVPAAGSLEQGLARLAATRSSAPNGAESFKLSSMNRFNKLWWEWCGFIVFLVLMVVFRSAAADWYQVPTGSMKPTIIEGDRIFVNKLAYDLKVPFTLLSIATWGEPARGDIIVFDSPVENNRLVKRVIGVPGDIVEIRNNRVFVNGRAAHYAPASQAAVKKYWPQNPRGPVLYREGFGAGEHNITIMPRLLVPARNYGPVAVEADHFFVLGDNRDNSADSRYIGTIHRRYILGRASAVVASFQHLERSLTALE